MLRKNSFSQKFFKFTIFIFIAFFAVFSAKAQNILSAYANTNSSEENLFFSSFTANTHTSFEPYVFSLQTGYVFEKENLSTTTALHFARESIQITEEGVFWPFRFSRLRMGFGGVVNIHFDSVYDTEINFLPGFYIQFKPFSIFMLSAHTNYFSKGRFIYSVSDAQPILINRSVALGIRASFYPNKSFMLYISLDSTEIFRYMIFMVPTFALGATYNANSNWMFLAEINVRYVDFFTLSAQYEGGELRFSVGYKL